MKLPKDARQTVRYNSDLYVKLKEKGWTVQKLLDWAIAQQSEVTTAITVKKPKKS